MEYGFLVRGVIGGQGVYHFIFLFFSKSFSLDSCNYSTVVHTRMH